MEKIIRYIIVISFLTGTSLAGYSQEWTSSLQFAYSTKSITADTNQTTYPSLVFPSKTYDNSFTIKNFSATGTSLYIGLGNDISFNKNIITTSFGINFHNYDFGLRIAQVDSINTYSSDSSLTIKGDRQLWDEIKADGTNQFDLTKVYPALRLAVGYQRVLFNFKSFVPSVSAGLEIERRFNLNGTDSITLDGSYPYVYTVLNNQFNQKQFTFSPYVGFSFRLGAHSFGINSRFSLRRIDDENGVMNFNETSLSIVYSKTLGLNKISKEQVIYDEYQHLGLSKSAEYRKGDKFSYMTIGFDHSKLINYNLSTAIVKEGVYNGDTLTATTNGYSVTPTINFGLSFNTYATHRWMIGLGFDIYQEYYNSNGSVYDSISNSSTSFSAGEAPTQPNSIYSEFDKSSKFAPSVTSAIYISKRILKIDPYVKGSALMVMNYDVPSFLKTDPEWRSLGFFPIYKIGAGVDLRLRIKSSKFLILGLGIDYNLNPHINYIQYSIKMGYYRKKKLKNQTY